MAKKVTKRRKRYTAEQRATILAAAQKDHLTAKDVHKKFGVSAVTYYSWRKKAGAPRKRARRVPAASGAARAGSLRATVQARLGKILPRLVEQEVARYLDLVLGTGGRRRRRSQ